MKKTIAVLAASLIEVACANRPEAIPASYVSHEKYAHLDCATLDANLRETQSMLARYSAIQNKKADEDALGVFLFGVPFSKLSGDVQNDIARLKGQIEAIETASIRKQCSAAGVATAGTPTGAEPPSASEIPLMAPSREVTEALQETPADWLPVLGPDELQAIYSDTTVHGKIYGRNTAQGTPYIGHFRRDGTGEVIFKGRRFPRSWEVSGRDMICTRSEQARDCYRMRRSRLNPDKYSGRHVSRDLAVEFTVERARKPARVSANTAHRESAGAGSSGPDILRPSAGAVAPAALARPENVPAPAATPAPKPPLESAQRTEMTLAAQQTGRDLRRFPRPGTVWHYRIRDRQFSRPDVLVVVRLRDVARDFAEEEISVEGADAGRSRRMLDWRRLRIVEHPLSKDLALIEPAPYLLTAKGEEAVSLPLSMTGYPVGPGMPNWHIRSSAGTWVDIDVPAGHMRAIRIEILGRLAYDFFGNSDQRSRFRLVAWYAPTVKRLVRLEHETWSTSPDVTKLSHDLIELISYRPTH